MAKTNHLGLNLPLGTDITDVSLLNENSEILDREVSARIKTVNGAVPDESGDAQVDTVPFANTLVTGDNEVSGGAYNVRVTGGDKNISDGKGRLAAVYGRCEHTGIAPESIQLTVHNETRPIGTDGITATLDRDTFIAYVGGDDDATVTLAYSGGWSFNPEWYGITVSGEPVDGDSITVVYTRAVRGTITPSSPSAFRANGWNLYNHDAGYARVAKYGDDIAHGYLVDGSYTSLQYSHEEEGTRQSITVVSGGFNVPDDGYVWVNNGDSSTTFILPIREDWMHGEQGEWQAYREDSIDLSGVMSLCFLYGLCRVGGVADEINLLSQKAIRRIGLASYSTATIAALEAAGTPFDADEENIYYVLDEPVETRIELDGAYDAVRHGTEIIDGTGPAPYVRTVYGADIMVKIQEIEGDIADIETTIGNMVIMPSAPIAIPSGSQPYRMEGITEAHQVLRWNFSTASTQVAENNPPCNLTITTGNGTFTIVNDSGTAGGNIQPVFGVPGTATATAIN